MPVPYLSNLSKETGKSLDELEKLWGEAKKIASEHFNKPESEFGNKEFAYVVGVIKKMTGVEDKKESLEIILTEDFHIPGTDLIIEKGDKIQVIARKNEAYGDDYELILKAIINTVERYNLHRKYDDRGLYKLITDAADEAAVRVQDL